MYQKTQVLVVLDTGERISCIIPAENGKYTLKNLADCVFGKTGLPDIALKFFWRGEQMRDFLPPDFATSGEVIQAIVESPKIVSATHNFYDGDYLLYAVQMGRLDAAKRIIEESADAEDILNQKIYDELSILSMVLTQEMAELLVAAGANPEEFCWPLHRGDQFREFKPMIWPLIQDRLLSSEELRLSNPSAKIPLRKSHMMDLGATPASFEETENPYCKFCGFIYDAKHISSRMMERGCEKYDCSDVSREDELRLNDLTDEEEEEEEEDGDEDTL